MSKKPILMGLLIVPGLLLAASAIPNEWRYSQDVTVGQRGLIRLTLPAADLAVAQPTLGDLRVWDGNGTELAYLLQRSERRPQEWSAIASLKVSLETDRTLLLGTIPRLSQGSFFNSVRLQSAAREFLKAVTIEGSRDQTHWTTIAQSQAIFRQADGTEHLEIPVPLGDWLSLRIRLDDRISPPVPIQAAAVHFISANPSGMEDIPATILEQSSDRVRTTVQLRLPNRHSYMASLKIDADAQEMLTHFADPIILGSMTGVRPDKPAT